MLLYGNIMISHFSSMKISRMFVSTKMYHASNRNIPRFCFHIGYSGRHSRLFVDHFVHDACRYLSTPKASQFWCQGKTCQRSSRILPLLPAPQRGSDGHHTSPLLSLVPRPTLARVSVAHTTFRAPGCCQSTTKVCAGAAVCSVGVLPMIHSVSGGSGAWQPRQALSFSLSVSVQV